MLFLKDSPSYSLAISLSQDSYCFSPVSHNTVNNLAFYMTLEKCISKLGRDMVNLQVLKSYSRPHSLYTCTCTWQMREHLSAPVPILTHTCDPCRLPALMSLPNLNTPDICAVIIIKMEELLT